MDSNASKESSFAFDLFLRIRPQKDGSFAMHEYYRPLNSKVMHIVVPTNSYTYRQGRLEADFEYSHIFDPESSQEQVFTITAKSILDSFLDGTNCLLMAYGVTGSGKTYTIIGPDKNPGILPRAIQYILNGVDSAEFKQKHMADPGRIAVEMSFLEDYQNCIYDLLSPSTKIGQQKQSLAARVDGQGVLRIVNLAEYEISSFEDGLALLQMGAKEKHVAETRMNVNSSRSHTMCTLSLVRKMQNSKEVIASCRIVDLAGSERTSRTNVTGETMLEAGAINTDLMYLMQFLREVVEKQNKSSTKILARNCKLTQLLSTSVIGNHAGPARMIINISCDKEGFDEMFNVMESTTIVKTIKTVQTKIDNRPPPMRTAGGRRIRMFSNIDRGDSVSIASRVMSIADQDGLNQVLKEKEKEMKEMKLFYEEQIRTLYESVEMEIRMKVVQELQRKQLLQEEELERQLNGIRKNYEQIEQGLREKMEEEKNGYESRLQEAYDQLVIMDQLNLELQDKLDCKIASEKNLHEQIDQHESTVAQLTVENESNKKRISKLRTEKQILVSRCADIELMLESSHQVQSKKLKSGKGSPVLAQPRNAATTPEKERSNESAELTPSGKRKRPEKLITIQIPSPASQPKKEETENCRVYSNKHFILPFYSKRKPFQHNTDRKDSYLL